MSDLRIKDVYGIVTVGDEKQTFYLNDSDIDRIVAIRDAHRR